MTTRQEFIKICKTKPRNKEMLSVVLTTDEKEKLKIAAKQEGLRVSDYVRSRLFYE